MGVEKVQNGHGLKLVHCIVEGFSSAVTFGLDMWGRDATGDAPKWFHSPGDQARIASGDLAIKIFDGVIVEIDDEMDEVFVRLRTGEGEEREFAEEGDATLYKIGKRMLVRYVELSRLRSGTIIHVLEIWLEE